MQKKIRMVIFFVKNSKSDFYMVIQKTYWLTETQHDIKKKHGIIIENLNAIQNI